MALAGSGASRSAEHAYELDSASLIQRFTARIGSQNLQPIRQFLQLLECPLNLRVRHMTLKIKEEQVAGFRSPQWEGLNPGQVDLALLEHLQRLYQLLKRKACEII